MRIRFYTEDMQYYLTFRPEDFQGKNAPLVLRKRKEKTVKAPQKPITAKDLKWSEDDLNAMTDDVVKDVMIEIFKELEDFLLAEGKESCILAKRVGKRYSVGAKDKRGNWVNGNGETLYEALLDLTGKDEEA